MYLEHGDESPSDRIINTHRDKYTYIHKHSEESLPSQITLGKHHHFSPNTKNHSTHPTQRISLPGKYVEHLHQNNTRNHSTALHEELLPPQHVEDIHQCITKNNPPNQHKDFLYTFYHVKPDRNTPT